MKVLGIGDEAASLLSGQIHATLELGWNSIEMRALEIPGSARANFHDIPDPAFDLAVRELEKANLHVHCFGSAIMNWAKKVTDPFQITQDEVKRTIPRIQRLGVKFVRIMSYKPDDHEYRIPSEVFRRVREVTNRFLDHGIQPLHENCMNFGGMSWQHALELLDNCPGLKWLFDTANPVSNLDRSKAEPWAPQDPWEFWTHLRDHVEHIHVKDGKWNAAKKNADYTWPGEGEGRLRDILRDAAARGYNGAISIEPHMVVAFHDTNSKTSDEDLLRNFVEYGRRTEALVADLAAELAARKSAQPSTSGRS
jgi:sugar phosphate isomerase/epimerase